MSEIDIDALMANISKEPEIAEAGPEDEVQEQRAETESPQARDPVEELAEEMGWNPNFTGSDKVSAREYIKRTQTFLRESSANLKSLREATKKHGEDIVRIQRQSWERAQAEAQARLDEAVRAGDHKAAKQAVEDLKQPEPVHQDTDADTGLPADVRKTLDAWVNDNGWFREDEDARAYAQAVYSRQVASLGVDDPARILPRVTEAVRKRFPEHWQTQDPEPEPEKRQAPPAVNGTPRRAGTIVRSSAPARGWNDMPAELRLLASQVIDEGGFRPDLKTLPERRAAYAAAYFAQEQR